MMPNATFFLDLRHASAEYPLSRRKIQQLIKDQRLPAYRVDGKIIVRRRDLEHLITQQLINPDLANTGTTDAG